MRLSAFVFCVIFVLCYQSLEAADALKAEPGIAREKPISGPSVKVAKGYMVPYAVTIPGTDVSFRMIPVPGGKCQIGSPVSEPDRADDEGPQLQVTVDPMWVAEKEVSWAEYKEFMNLYHIFKEFEGRGFRVVEVEAADAITAPTPLYDPSYTYEYGEEPNQPAVSMTQYSAQQYTKWLSRVLGQQFRIPTEAEWEYAARGGIPSGTYPWGSPYLLNDRGCFLANFKPLRGDYSADQAMYAVEAKSYLPNDFNLYNMAGNVAEWTESSYDPGAYEYVSSLNPNMSLNQESRKVVRGGSWKDVAYFLRVSSRDYEYQDTARSYIGFRTVQDYLGSEKVKIK